MSKVNIRILRESPEPQTLKEDAQSTADVMRKYLDRGLPVPRIASAVKGMNPIPQFALDSTAVTITINYKDGGQWKNSSSWVSLKYTGGSSPYKVSLKGLNKAKIIQSFWSAPKGKSEKTWLSQMAAEVGNIINKNRNLGGNVRKVRVIFNQMSGGARLTAIWKGGTTRQKRHRVVGPWVRTAEEFASDQGARRQMRSDFSTGRAVDQRGQGGFEGLPGQSAYTPSRAWRAPIINTTRAKKRTTYFMKRYRVSLQRLKRALSLGYERGDEYLERLQTKEERDVAREWIIATTNAAEGASSVNNTLVKGIAAYQMIMKLGVDGIAGPNTMRRLGLRGRKKKKAPAEKPTAFQQVSDAAKAAARKSLVYSAPKSGPNMTWYVEASLPAGKQVGPLEGASHKSTGRPIRAPKGIAAARTELQRLARVQWIRDLAKKPAAPIGGGKPKPDAAAPKDPNDPHGLRALMKDLQSNDGAL